MNNYEYIYVVFRHHQAMVDYDDDNIFLDIIFKTEEEAKNYITTNTDKKDKYTSFKYEKIKIGEFSYISMINLFS